MLWLFTQLPDTGRVLSFFHRVAAGTDGSAARAVIQYLSLDMGQPGLATLHRLYNEDVVKDPTAREHLAAIAAVNGWGQ